MAPSDECFGRDDRAGPQVDLGQIVQQQSIVVDLAAEVKFDVVAEQALQRHVITGHRDAVAARALG